MYNLLGQQSTFSSLVKNTIFIVSLVFVFKFHTHTVISVHDSLLGLFSALLFKYQNNYMNIDLVKARFKCESYVLKKMYTICI